jgi:serine/arginine repetitive matrix protein 2
LSSHCSSRSSSLHHADSPLRLDEDEIDAACDTLREKLSSQLHNLKDPRGRPTDSHSIAAAKELEMSKMQRALGVSADYVPGTAFHRETEEEKAARLAAREERDQARIEQVLKKEREDAQRKKEFEEREKLRRREEYYRCVRSPSLCSTGRG